MVDETIVEIPPANYYTLNEPQSATGDAKQNEIPQNNNYGCCLCCLLIGIIFAFTTIIILYYV